MADSNITRDVERYYTDKLRAHGATPQGVDWNGRDSQELRYAQLAKILDGRTVSALTDVGCGYGGFLPFLRDRGFTGRFIGTDLSADMVAAAQISCAGLEPCEFQVAAGPTGACDVITASGVFSVKLGHGDAAWKAYILDTLEQFNRHAEAGFAFNCLTSYSDKDRMRPDLYYADPLFVFDHCKRNFSRQVALLHDYGLYEFTVLVRK